MMYVTLAFALAVFVIALCFLTTSNQRMDRILYSVGIFLFMLFFYRVLFRVSYSLIGEAGSSSILVFHTTIMAGSLLLLISGLFMKAIPMTAAENK
ncbi:MULTISPECIES: hypothetical protein [Bacillaceae]|uniref:hypothetical protein n=1 Tax=Bacillaceae TaxID=186817 RepID=UPI000B0FD4F4|nr:hypothetical protein [Bacillus sp. FJAT-27916]